MKGKACIWVVFILLWATTAQAGLLGDFIRGMKPSSAQEATDTPLTASGLKEALTVGSGNAVGLL